MKQIIFPHIPKTAGSSFLSSLVEANVPAERVYRYRTNAGVRQMMFDRQARNADFVSAHLPHGLHRFTSRSVAYMTFLRDPIDRAVSWYYWIKDMDRIDLYRRHPLRNYADSVSIKEFYENPVHANTQTRYIAGIAHHAVYPRMRLNGYHEHVLKRAKAHLTSYACFGLLERFEESVGYIMQAFDWQERHLVERQRSTKRRPTVRDIMEIDPRIIDELRRYHQLDLRLYDFANELFERRSRELGFTVPTPPREPASSEALADRA